MTPFARTLALWLIVALAILVLFNMVTISDEQRQTIISWLPMVGMGIGWLVAASVMQKRYLRDYYAKADAVNERLHAANEAIIALLADIRDQRAVPAAAANQAVAGHAPASHAPVTQSLTGPTLASPTLASPAKAA